MRVVNNTADPKAVVSPKMRTNVDILRNKQTVFSKNIRHFPSHHIQSLELFLPSAGITLRQALMGIKTSAEQQKSLFISADTDPWDRIMFTFHKRHEEEALSIIPVLPVYIAHQYGPRSWSWFNANAKEELTDYYYHPESGEIRCSDDKYYQDIVDENQWESKPESNKVQVEFSLAKWVVDINNMPTSNQYDDNGTVRSGLQSSVNENDSGVHSNTSDTATDTTSTNGGISTLTGDSEKDKLIELLKDKPNHLITDIINQLQSQEEAPTYSESRATERGSGPSQE